MAARSPTVRSMTSPSDYTSGALHPLDLKDGVAARLTELLEPARQHFDQPGPRELLAELEALVETG